MLGTGTGYLLLGAGYWELFFSVLGSRYWALGTGHIYLLRVITGFQKKNQYNNCKIIEARLKSRSTCRFVAFARFPRGTPGGALGPLGSLLRRFRELFLARVISGLIS